MICPRCGEGRAGVQDGCADMDCPAQSQPSRKEVIARGDEVYRGKGITQLDRIEANLGDFHQFKLAMGARLNTLEDKLDRLLSIKELAEAMKETQATRDQSWLNNGFSTQTQADIEKFHQGDNQTESSAKAPQRTGG